MRSFIILAAILLGLFDCEEALAQSEEPTKIVGFILVPLPTFEAADLGSARTDLDETELAEQPLPWPILQVADKGMYRVRFKNRQVWVLDSTVKVDVEVTGTVFNPEAMNFSSKDLAASRGDGNGDEPAGETGHGREIRASRLFAGPNQYPAKEFAAYGILAFRSRASSYDLGRHILICEGYINTIPAASELDVEISQQMVTVWPIDSDVAAGDVAKLSREKVCGSAVAHYGLVTAKRALRDAELAGADTSDNGPYLLAWSPSSDKGKQDSLILVADLSDITTYEQAHERFLEWSREIERDPELWSKGGWDIGLLRTKVRLWVDRFGPKVLAVFGTEG